MGPAAARSRPSLLPIARISREDPDPLRAGSCGDQFPIARDDTCHRGRSHLLQRNNDIDTDRARFRLGRPRDGRQSEYPDREHHDEHVTRFLGATTSELREHPCSLIWHISTINGRLLVQPLRWWRERDEYRGVSALIRNTYDCCFRGSICPSLSTFQWVLAAAGSPLWAYHNSRKRPPAAGTMHA